MKGIVFDIQRCSFHDGPGIRTTVFLKGCPLRCQWCHNPESQTFRPQIMYDVAKCNGCLSCAVVCVQKAHSFNDTTHTLNFEKCLCCGACVIACPNKALSVVGKEMSVEEVMMIVMRDVAFYSKSGGGITLSGGEPMAQFAFSMKLLALAKDQGIHTCIETSGYADTERFEKVMPFVDLFLFDYKATGNAMHQKLTGVSDGLILKNLDFLCRNGAAVSLRCPLIPGVNDSDEHLAGIAALSEKYPNLLGIEIMSYHNMGVGKAVKIGREQDSAIEPVTEQTRRKWLDELTQLGCGKVSVST